MAILRLSTRPGFRSSFGSIAWHTSTQLSWFFSRMLLAVLLIAFSPNCWAICLAVILNSRYSVSTCWRELVAAM
ncbi:hypothetical protein D9M70_571970 [compost metagenome]